MNLSNKLTLSRIIVIPIFLVCLTPQRFRIPVAWNPIMHSAALLLFVAASITDYWDGALARKHGWITNFGKLLDPVADKVLVMAAFVGLVEPQAYDVLFPEGTRVPALFPAWMVILVLAREFLITGLRTIAMAEGRVLAADRWGKNKTISQLVTIITALVFLVARDWLSNAGLWDHVVMRRWEVDRIARMTLKLMMAFCVLITVLSGWRYLVANRDIIKDA